MTGIPTSSEPPEGADFGSVKGLPDFDPIQKELQSLKKNPKEASKLKIDGIRDKILSIQTTLQNKNISKSWDKKTIQTVSKKLQSTQEKFDKICSQNTIVSTLLQQARAKESKESKKIEKAFDKILADIDTEEKEKTVQAQERFRNTKTKEANEKKETMLPRQMESLEKEGMIPCDLKNQKEIDERLDMVKDVLDVGEKSFLLNKTQDPEILEVLYLEKIEEGGRKDLIHTATAKVKICEDGFKFGATDHLCDVNKAVNARQLGSLIKKLNK